MVCDYSSVSLHVQNTKFTPPLFLAPMAGLTHSAFRRLVADFGGYGALYTEMLSGTALLNEKCGQTPFTRRRKQEGKVAYQLLLKGTENIESVIERVAALNPAALDLNLACPAPEIRKQQAGAMLFVDTPRLQQVVRRVRKAWSGILTAKCRLGGDPQDWQQSFSERMRLLEDEGIDAIIVHPRFFKEKFKRLARWRYLPWIANQVRVPVIASGDIGSPDVLQKHAKYFGKIKGIMIGRMAVVKPWIFTEFSGSNLNVDYAEVWERYCSYVQEDFPETKAVGRIKQFSAYFARNFFYGHQFFSGIQNASSLKQIISHARKFFDSPPRVVLHPSVSGV